MNTRRCVAISMSVLLLLATLSVPAALGMQGESPIQSDAPALPITYSGDDDYDPAAGGTPKLSAVGLPERSAPATAVSYGGDDDYDPAAGGTPEGSVAILAADISRLVACTPPADEIAALNALTTSGGYSGDDDYDPAAGGAPELSLLAFVRDSATLVTCDPAASGN